MDYIHQTIDSDSLLGIFNVPVSLRNTKVEVLVFPAGGNTIPIGSAPSGNSAFGCLKKYADPAKIAGEKGAWQRAVIEKYAKN
ncbi:hypothetical protein FACS1894109_15420 [Spirochaetia bacterium]|nr:hypothetical protein FACS1894109_15420 [Spirochaetia bacterium]